MLDSSGLFHETQERGRLRSDGFDPGRGLMGNPVRGGEGVPGLGEPVTSRGEQGPVGGEERLQQDEGEEVVLGAGPPTGLRPGFRTGFRPGRRIGLRPGRRTGPRPGFRTGRRSRTVPGVLQPVVGELLEDRLLQAPRPAADRAGVTARCPVLQLAGDLGADLGPAHHQMLQLGGLRVAGVLDGHGVEKADQSGEGLHVAVVRGGAGQDQGVGALGEEVGQRPAVAALVDQVVGFVDDDGVPMDVLQPRPVAARVLQRVHGDDHTLVIGERVASGRDPPLDAGDARAVQADQREGEPRPHLVLELFQDGCGRDDEDAFASAPADQFAEQHSDLQGLAQPHHVTDQEARTQRVGEGLGGGPELVVHAVQEEAVGQGQAALGLRQRGLAEHGLQEETAAPEVRRTIGDQLRVLGKQHAGPVHRRREEPGFLPAHEVGGADGLDQVLPGPDLPTAADHPLLVADLDDRAGRRRTLGCRHGLGFGAGLGGAGHCVGHRGWSCLSGHGVLEG